MPHPSGTITFLFTDIEGSTRLWEEQPEAMRTALARHDALMRQAIEANAGVVFKTVGDAFCAAFATAPAALAAALAAQSALQAEPWPSSLLLRVRMALHTGAAELRDDDYFGPPLNRIARLLGIGHGGQALLSEVARDLTQDALPPSVTLRSLGEHRLRDLGRPEPVFQLLHPALISDFPPLKSLDNPELPNNLPRQVTSFIGREKEMERVRTLLGTTRLLTLTGSGGCGKTRLALQVAAEALESYPQGVWLVELAPLTDPALVPQAVAQSLGVGEAAGMPILQRLVEALKNRHILLLLDNCEHLLDVCAYLADALLRACPQVHILASSREGLGIAGETVYRIPSLSLPDLKQAQTATPATLDLYESVRLFVERATASLPSFVVTNTNAPALASVCHRLDGIPLALELAATRVRSLSIEEINSKLDNRFRLLTGGSRTALPRQQTLRALIDWSYGLLSEQEKTLLCRLSVFVGGWTLEEAEAVCSEDGIETWETLDLLTGLADKSLIVTEPEDEHTRYRLLETVRQYARDRLVENAASERVRERHQAFFLAFAETAAPHMKGPEGKVWLDRVERTFDNLRTAMEWENPAEALRIAVALNQIWLVRGHYTEGRRWLTDLLAHERNQAPTPVRARGLYIAALLARRQDDYAEALALHERSLPLFQELGLKDGIADNYQALGNISYIYSDWGAARSWYERSRALFEELGARRGLAIAVSNLANVATEQEDYAAAHALYMESVALDRELGNKEGLARNLHNMGTGAYRQGDYAAARRLQEESLDLARQLGEKPGIAAALMELGVIAFELGEYAAAQAFQEQCLALYRELGHKLGIAHALGNLGNVALGQGDYAAAQALHEQGLTIKQELGDSHGIALVLTCLSSIAFAQGDYTAAQARQEQSLALNRELGNQRGIAACLRDLGAIACQQGRYHDARSFLEESLTLARKQTSQKSIVGILECFATLAKEQEQTPRAATLWGASEALREMIGAPIQFIERTRYESEVAQAHAALGDDAFTAAWTQGRTLTLEQAMEYALKTGETVAKS